MANQPMLRADYLPYILEIADSTATGPRRQVTVYPNTTFALIGTILAKMFFYSPLTPESLNLGSSR